MTFLDRQKYFDQLSKDHAERRKQQEDELSAQLFQPRVHRGTEAILSSARPEMLLEGPDERARRMSQIEKQRIEAHRRDIEQEVYNENDYSFVPNIDKVSRMLGRSSSIDELHENRRGQRAKMDAVRRAEEITAQECSFRPKINRNYTAAEPSGRPYNQVESWDACPVAEEEMGVRLGWLGEHSSQGNRELSKGVQVHGAMRVNLREPEKMARDIRLHLAEKEEKRREILAEREIAELKECTFCPKVPKNKSSTYSSPVVVRGIARHLELQNLSEQKRRDKALREKEAFEVKNAKKFRKTGDGNTVVEVGFIFPYL